MKLWDISVAVHSKTVVWPNTPKPAFKKILSMANGGNVNDTEMVIGAHIGTHLDAPSHFLLKGETIDKLPLNIFMGPATVIGTTKAKVITGEFLESLNLSKSIERILFKTTNSFLWRKRETKFNKNYVGLDTSAAHWLAGRNLKLIGVDYLSIAKFDEAKPVHQILLKKNIALLEGINLDKIKPGAYQLICFPTKLSGLEAAPTRAVLLTF